MTCGKCGALNSNSRAFCKSCGFSLWPTLKAETAPVAPVDSNSMQPGVVSLQPTIHVSRPVATDSNDVSEFYGVRGWLLWFCIVLTIINPLVLAADAAKTRDVLAIAIDLGLASLFVYTGISLWRIKPKSLDLVKLCFACQLGLAALLLITVVESKRRLMEPDLSFNPSLEGGVRTVAYVIIWWAYFKKSKRVRATYGSNL